VSLIREWLTKFALNAGQSLDVKTLGVFEVIWLEAFEDLSCDVLEAAFKRTLRESKYWPIKIADVRSYIDQANSAGLELEAAKAWENYLAHVQKYFHPDIGWNRRTPELDAKTEHAASAAGGARYVEGCPESELQWARKRFIEDYTLVHETAQRQNILTRGEARKILEHLTAEPSKKQLPRPAQPSASGPEPSNAGIETVLTLDDAFKKIRAPKPTPTPLSQEERERRKRTQKEALARYLKSQEVKSTNSD
jgi:hypothetical protein